MRASRVVGFDRRALLAGLGASALGRPAAAAGPSWSDVTGRLAVSFPPDAPGAVAVAAKGDAIAYVRGFGLAEVELGAPMRADSVLRIASLTKQFTAVAILRLVEAARLDLGDTLAGRLADCPPGWQTITLRQLLSQTSGLTDDMGPIFSQPLVDRTPSELLAPYRDRPLAAAPGAHWRYSNLNYWILGQVIEAATGEAFADHVSRHVLASGMTRTRYGDALAIVPGRALGYEAASAGGWRNARPFSQSIGYAAGGFLSTPLEMARWYAALGRGEIVSRTLLDLAGRDVATTDGKPTGYGLGWYVSKTDGDVTMHHGGSSVGFESYLFWIPSKALFSGVFKNRNDARGEPQIEAHALLEDLIRRR